MRLILLIMLACLCHSMDDEHLFVYWQDKAKIDQAKDDFKGEVAITFTGTPGTIIKIALIRDTFIGINNSGKAILLWPKNKLLVIGMFGLKHRAFTGATNSIVFYQESAVYTTAKDFTTELTTVDDGSM